MDVLNTYGGGTDTVLIMFGIFGFVAGIAALSYGFVEAEVPALILGVLAVIVGIAAIVSSDTPIRHEVTIRPGHVIDATKYDVIEQRGAIYVIEEREQTEAK
ncbi:hypothetical protein [Paenibacillus xylanexedens]|uniref:hypothetical protein n=1 Tax=Paenibacillus xylanexedens TaxID=528191 RepID=UPI0011A09A9F|nr:hypothetical protein [Paenibacillus xylanexedens]